MFWSMTAIALHSLLLGQPLLKADLRCVVFHGFKSLCRACLALVFVKAVQVENARVSDVACCICLGILCPAAGQLLDVTSASKIHRPQNLVP